MKIRNRFPVVAKQKKHQLETDIEKVHIIYMAVNEMWKWINSIFLNIHIEVTLSNSCQESIIKSNVFSVRSFGLT